MAPPVNGVANSMTAVNISPKPSGAIGVNFDFSTTQTKRIRPQPKILLFLVWTHQQRA